MIKKFHQLNEAANSDGKNQTLVQMLNDFCDDENYSHHLGETLYAGNYSSKVKSTMGAPYSNIFPLFSEAYDTRDIISLL